MGFFPPFPDDGEDLGSGLPPELYETWIAAVQRLYPDALTPEEAKARLQSDAEEILRRVEPYTYGAKPLAEEDPVEWAEQITRDAATTFGRVISGPDEDGRYEVDLAPTPEARCAPLSRPRRRFARRRTGGALSWLLGAAKALRRRL